MDINRNNYEVFFLDYAEGNLSADQVEILHRFLKFNPDLSAELETFSVHPLESNLEEFPNKNLLKKSFPGEGDLYPGENFEMFCLAYLEGDLTKEQESTFEEYIKENSVKGKEFEIFRKTFIPVEIISFPFKSKLKRRKPLIINWKIVIPIAAAAAISLMIIIGPEESAEPLEMAVIMEQQSNEEPAIVTVEDKGPAIVKAPSTLKVIKNSKSPVPVSDYKKENPQNNEDKEKKGKENTEAQNQAVKMAGLDLRYSNLPEMNSTYDQLVYISVDPRTINLRSFSAIDMAKYQFQKASSVMEEEDVLIWSLASKGLKELNKITGSEAQLLASRNEEGSISGIKFKSRLLNITTPISREE